jgi:undecaprenyl-diphosphatase
VLIATAIAVAVADPVPGDRAVLDAIHDLTGTSLDSPARWTGWTATAWVLVPAATVAAAWAAWTRRWRVLALVAAAAVVAWLVNPLLKRVFTRDRPAVRALVEPTSPWSFPAGHAAAAAAFAACAVIVAWPTRARTAVTVAAAAYVGLVGGSRLVLTVHFPTDLVAGWALAVAGVAGVAATLAGRRGRAPDSAS